VRQLLLHNARVITMDPALPRAEAVAVHAGRIVAAGSAAEAAAALDGDAERFDCEGRALLPAFIDAHCHLLSYAASLRSIDCTGARSIADIQRLIRERAAVTPAGRWLRAFGYEETALAEGRHPNRHDLDVAAPERPVRLIHRSGHASILNSLALRMAGITIETEEPLGGFLDREVDTGEPSGLLIDMDAVIDRALPPLEYSELAGSVREASARFLEAGVVSIHDATATNGREAWSLFERLMADGALPLDVTMMEGIDHLGELPELACDGRLRRGAVKVVLSELGGSLSPDERELSSMVRSVHAAGRQVAIHAVGEEAVLAATRAIESALRERPRADHRHRIEHCSVLPERVAPRLAEIGVVVVSQPSFVEERGDRYLELVSEERQPKLYAFRTLVDAGVRFAAGSDAPVTQPSPLGAARAAARRRTASGRPLAHAQAVDPSEALRWWTAGAAYAGFQERERGAARPGMRADLVLLSGGAAAVDALEGVEVDRVWHGGVPAMGEKLIRKANIK
jgi:predicted amidohydrolase YtcJ